VSVNTNPCIEFCHAVQAVGDWLFGWQTLLAGLIAFGGALWTVKTIRAQITQADSQEANRLRRRFQAVRASLPLALAAANEYSRAVIYGLEEAKTLYRTGRNQALVSGWRPPSLPADLSKELRDFLETTDDEAAIKLVSELFRQLQVLSSRIASLTDPNKMKDRIAVRMNIAEYQLQAALVHAMTDALYPFSRGEVESPPNQIERKAVLGIFNQIGLDADADTNLRARLKTFRSVDAPAWPRKN